MNFGVYLSSVGAGSDAALLAELAREAEASRWDGAFIWDHIGQPHSAADAWVSLAAMAMTTERIRIGPIVTPVARRRPWKLARETTTVDRLSKGRLVLGVGLGWSELEFTTFGEDGEPRVRAEKLDEGLDVLAGLWSGGTFSHAGKHYQVTDARFEPRPQQRPRIPIWVCGAWSPRSRAAFRRAARWDGVVAICGTGEDRAITPSEIEDVRAYIQTHRRVSDPFDVVVILWSEGTHSTTEAAEVERYKMAGATWWLEDLSCERFATIEEARARLRLGPPGEWRAPSAG